MMDKRQQDSLLVTITYSLAAQDDDKYKPECFLSKITGHIDYDILLFINAKDPSQKCLYFDCNSGKHQPVIEVDIRPQNPKCGVDLVPCTVDTICKYIDELWGNHCIYLTSSIQLCKSKPGSVILPLPRSFPFLDTCGSDICKCKP